MLLVLEAASSAVSSGSMGWRAKSSRIKRSTRMSLRISASWELSSRLARRLEQHVGSGRS